MSTSDSWMATGRAGSPGWRMQSLACCDTEVLGKRECWSRSEEKVSLPNAMNADALPCAAAEGGQAIRLVASLSAGLHNNPPRGPGVCHLPLWSFSWHRPPLDPHRRNRRRSHRGCSRRCAVLHVSASSALMLLLQYPMPEVAPAWPYSITLLCIWPVCGYISMSDAHPVLHERDIRKSWCQVAPKARVS